MAKYFIEGNAFSAMRMDRITTFKPASMLWYAEKMIETYTIGDFARAGDVATSTVRYYERAGLLEPSARTDGNYRVYGREELERLRFIRAAQSAGFTLEDISALIMFRDGNTAPCAEVQHLIEHRLDELRKRLAELRHVETHLKSALQVCQQAEQNGHCNVLDELTNVSKT